MEVDLEERAYNHFPWITVNCEALSSFYLKPELAA